MIKPMIKKLDIILNYILGILGIISLTMFFVAYLEQDLYNLVLFGVLSVVFLQRRYK